jgi:hypothetical protein
MTPEEFSRLAEQEKIAEKIIAPGEAVDLAGKIHLAGEAADRVRKGQPLRLSDLGEGEQERLRKGQWWGLFLRPGGLLAIAESQVDGGPLISGNSQALRILRVFQG